MTLKMQGEQIFIYLFIFPAHTEARTKVGWNKHFCCEYLCLLQRNSNTTKKELLLQIIATL